MSDNTDNLIDEAIDNALQTPQSSSADGISSTERSVDDLLKLQKMRSAKKAKRGNGFGIRTVPVHFPGSER